METDTRIRYDRLPMTQVDPIEKTVQPAIVGRVLHRWLPAVCGSIALVGGLASLVGWIFNRPRLTDWPNSGISMFPNTSLCACLCGVVLLAAKGDEDRPRNALLRAVAGLIIVISGLTLIQHLTGVDFKIDRLIVDRPWGQSAAASPMRMGPPASISFLLCGCAVLLTSFPARAARVAASTLAGLAVAIASLSLLGYLYGAKGLYTIPRYTGIALQSAIIIWLIGVGLIFLLPNVGLARILLTNDVGGSTVRRLFIPLTVVAVLLGWVRVLGQSAGFYDTAFGTAARTLIEIVFFMILLWAAGRSMSKSEDDRRRTHASLKRSHDTFARLINNAPLGIYVIDSKFRVAQVSKGCEKVFGGINPLIGRDFGDVLRTIWQEPFASQAISLFRKTLQTGEPYRSAATTEQRNNIELTESYDWQIERIVLPDDTFGVVCYFYDLTDIREAQSALKESESRFRTMSDAAPVLMWLSDERKNRVWFNKPWQEFVGHGMEEDVGYGWVKNVHPEDVERCVGEYESNFDARTPFAMDYRLRRADGEYRWMLVRGVPHFDGGSRFIGYIGLCIDVTEAKQNELERERLLKSEREALLESRRVGRMKDEFLATLSHELRTPMTAILGWAHLLRKNPISNSPERVEMISRGLDIIERNAKLQLQIIEDLLDMSSIISGKIRLNIEDVDLGQVVNGAVDAVRPAAEAKGIKLVSVCNSSAAIVRGDPNRLQQVVYNLLTNAIKFTPHATGAKIQVSCERVNSHFEVSVTDTGKGIAPDFLPHVFERFRQQDASTTRSHGGLGLGLAIVKQLVELHGGRVFAASDGENMGSTFTIHMPVAAAILAESNASMMHSNAKAETSPDVVEALQRLEGVRMLVVDDEQDTRMLLRSVLERFGAEVVTAENADEAIVLLKEHLPHVLLSDIGMPVMDGYELIQRIRALPAAEGGHVPAIALTAYSRSEDRMRALLAGFQSHLSKPVEVNELVATVRSTLGELTLQGGQKS